MGNISAIKYIDAYYFKKGERFLPYISANFKTHYCVGLVGDLKSKKDFIKVLFSYSKDYKSERGILIPKSAVVFEENNKYYRLPEENISLINKDTPVGVWWDDITYFDGENIPRECSKMYSEGKVLEILEDRIILINPTTLNLSNKLQNHKFEEDISVVVIPRCLITGVESFK